ncbi:hypothetical protein K438DRAFT_1750959 [Mycena galopus ATCC 62051]|nr:hypothetical protein K438DRAFT_1750959 [Mycena galopus ATCC 62051]
MRWLWLSTVLSLFQLASATVQNITVDDQNGGPDGTSIIYQPADAWVQGAIGGCSDCPPPPISSQAFMNTFHGSLFNQNNSKRIQNPPFATLFFIVLRMNYPLGSSVSVNCILSNALSDPVGISEMTFSIDGIQRSTYVHTPTGSPNFDPTTVFTFSDLSLANHTLEIKNGNAGGGSSLIILDSITFDDLSSTPSSVSDPVASATSITYSNSPTGTSGASGRSRNIIIIASVVPASLFLILVSLVIWLRRRSRQRKKAEPPGLPAPFLKTYVQRRRSRQRKNTEPPGLPAPFLKTYVQPTGHVPAEIPIAARPTSIASDGRSITISSIRREYLEQELRATQEKIIDLNGLERHGHAPPENVRASRLFRVFSTRTRRNSQQVPRSELDAAWRHNEELLARIRDLEAQMQSAWALGLSDDPLPEYND